jgi:hypothetical protein
MKKKTDSLLTDVIMGSVAIGVVEGSSIPGSMKQGTEGLIGLSILNSASKKFKL